MDRSSEDHWSRVHTHIDALLDLPIEEHETYLDAHCPDQAVRRDVKSWLAYIYTPTDVLDESVATYARALLDDGPPPARPPLWSAGASSRAHVADSTAPDSPASASESGAGLDSKDTTNNTTNNTTNKSDNIESSSQSPSTNARPSTRERRSVWPLWIGTAALLGLLLWWTYTA